MFINLSNHQSALWSDEQIRSARKYGDIVDFPFPEIPPEADEADADAVAAGTAREVMKMNPDAVMCQGEFSVTCRLVSLFKKEGLPVLAACSKRETVETVDADGAARKTSTFRFVRFRRY